MRILISIFLFVAIPLRSLLCASAWHSVNHTTKPVTLHAEQAILQTEKAPEPRDKHIPIWYGYGGPTNLHTRNLRFSCEGTLYRVPDSFVDDLLWLHADWYVRASINGRDIVFTMNGCDGEKGYAVHFHFRDGRFFQRILAYSEDQDILIRTNDA